MLLVSELHETAQKQHLGNSVSSVEACGSRWTHSVLKQRSRVGDACPGLCNYFAITPSRMFGGAGGYAHLTGVRSDALLGSQEGRVSEGVPQGWLMEKSHVGGQKTLLAPALRNHACVRKAPGMSSSPVVEGP